MKFRKKPVVIDAFQMCREDRWAPHRWPDWLNEAWQKPRDTPGSLQPRSYSGPLGPSDDLDIVTLEGNHQVTFGDWIIRGVKGELYACKPDIFEMTYESFGIGEQPA